MCGLRASFWLFILTLPASVLADGSWEQHHRSVEKAAKEFQNACDEIKLFSLGDLARQVIRPANEDLNRIVSYLTVDEKKFLDASVHTATHSDPAVRTRSSRKVNEILTSLVSRVKAKQRFSVDVVQTSPDRLPWLRVRKVRSWRETAFSLIETFQPIPGRGYQTAFAFTPNSGADSDFLSTPLPERISVIPQVFSKIPKECQEARTALYPEQFVVQPMQPRFQLLPDIRVADEGSHGNVFVSGK